MNWKCSISIVFHYPLNSFPLGCNCLLAEGRNWFRGLKGDRFCPGKWNWLWFVDFFSFCWKRKLSVGTGNCGCPSLHMMHLWVYWQSGVSQMPFKLWLKHLLWGNTLGPECGWGWFWDCMNIHHSSYSIFSQGTDGSTLRRSLNCFSYLFHPWTPSDHLEAPNLSSCIYTFVFWQQMTVVFFVLSIYCKHLTFNLLTIDIMLSLPLFRLILMCILFWQFCKQSLIFFHFMDVIISDFWLCR